MWSLTIVTEITLTNVMSTLIIIKLTTDVIISDDAMNTD